MQEYKPYSMKKGIGFGAFGGFVDAIAFTGIILALPFLFDMPTGIFLHTLGLLVTPNIVVDDPALVGMAAFAIILIQGISIGIVFGIVTSQVLGLHPSRKRKGVAMGLATGAIAYFIIYVPMIIAVFPSLLSDAVVIYSEEKLSMFGLSDYTLTTRSAYFVGTLGFGLVAYFAYGAIMGGIVTLEYSVYHFVVMQREKEEEQEHGSIHA
jgi:hypothetical protein